MASHKPTVWVSRPAPQAVSLAAELAAYADVLSVPIYVIEPTVSDRAALNTALKLDQYQHVICVSVNAVEIGVEWLENYWPQWPSQQRWWAVGSSTQQALARHDIQASVPTRFDSEGLIDILLPCIQPDDQVLIVRGGEGRSLLADVLQQHNVTVDYLDAYKRDINPDLMSQLTSYIEDIDVAFISSTQALEALLFLNPSQRDGSVCWVVPSERALKYAKSLGFANVVQAKSARDNDMIAAFLDWWEQ